MLSHYEKTKSGLTFSLNDVNIDSNNLDLVPILLNTPEKEDLDIDTISQNNLICMDLPSTQTIDLSYNFTEEPEEPYFNSEVKIQEKSNLTNINYEIPFTTDSVNHYEPVKHHWFYCAIINGLAEWKPFSKIDSNHIEFRFLESCETGIHFEDCVSTDGGRYDVLIHRRQKTSVYWEEAPMEIRRCSWFYRPEEQTLLLPYQERESELLEQNYHYVYDKGLWNEILEPFGMSIDPRLLEDKFVFHSVHTMVEYRRYRDDSTGGRQGRVVYRGLDGLSAIGIPDGDSETIDHVVFVLTAGAGQVRYGRHAVESASSLRQTVSAMYDYHYRERQARIEVLPVPWQFPIRGHDPSMVARITGKTVRKLRQFTNEIVLQFLGYEHDSNRRGMLTELARTMNRLRHRFSSRHPQYDGPVSIAAHGLASMIVFDLIALQEHSYERYGVDQSESPKSVSPFQLEFEVGHLFALGSPIALLIHCDRASNRMASQFEHLFELRHARGRLFNIFHPLDPFAYRLEPLLPSGGTMEPVIVPHYKGRRRLHLELKENLMRVGNDLKTRLVDTLRSTWSTLHEFAASHKSEIESDDRHMLLEGREILRALDKEDFDDSSGSTTDSPEMGRGNRDKRFDYVLQTSSLESFNDDIFALDSHNCYWSSEDTALMMLREIYRDSRVTRDTKPIRASATTTVKPVNVTSPRLTAITPPRPTVSTSLLPPTFHSTSVSTFFMPDFSESSNISNEPDETTSQSKIQSDQLRYTSKSNESSTFTTPDVLPARNLYLSSTPPVLPPHSVNSIEPSSSKALSSSSWSPVGSSMRGDGDNGDIVTLAGDIVHLDQHDEHWNRAEIDPEEEEGSSFDDSWYLNGQDMVPMGAGTVSGTLIDAGTGNDGVLSTDMAGKGVMSASSIGIGACERSAEDSTGVGTLGVEIIGARSGVIKPTTINYGINTTDTIDENAMFSNISVGVTDFGTMSAGTMNYGAMSAGTMNYDAMCTGTTDVNAMRSDVMSIRAIDAVAMSSSAMDYGKLSADTTDTSAMSIKDIDTVAMSSSAMDYGAMGAGIIDVNAISSGAMSNRAIDAVALSSGAMDYGAISAGNIRSCAINANVVINADNISPGDGVKKTDTFSHSTMGANVGLMSDVTINHGAQSSTVRFDSNLGTIVSTMISPIIPLVTQTTDEHMKYSSSIASVSASSDTSNDTGAVQQCYARYVSPTTLTQSQDRRQEMPLMMAPPLPMTIQSPLVSVFLPGQSQEISDFDSWISEQAPRPPIMGVVDRAVPSAPCEPVPVRASVPIPGNVPPPRTTWNAPPIVPVSMMMHPPPTYRHQAPPPLVNMTMGTMFHPGPADESGASDFASMFATVTQSSGVMVPPPSERLGLLDRLGSASSNKYVTMTTQIPLTQAQVPPSNIIRPVFSSVPTSGISVSQAQSQPPSSRFSGESIRSPQAPSGQRFPHHQLVAPPVLGQHLSRVTSPGNVSGTGPRASPLASPLFGAVSRPLTPRSGKVFSSRK